MTFGPFSGRQFLLGSRPLGRNIGITKAQSPFEHGELPDYIVEELRFLFGLEANKTLTEDDVVREVRCFRSIVDFALKAGLPEKRDLLCAFSNRSDELFSWVYSGAIQAVCANDPSWIQIGLVALAIEDLQCDWRQTSIYLSLLGNSARKIGAPIHKMADAAASVANPRCAALIQDFFNRALELQAIEGMGYREGTNEHGFTYLQGPF